MTYDILTALLLFAFVTSITPGPNNLMLLASGANYGFWRSVPHMLGVGIGFVVMLILTGIGLMAVFERYPVVQTGLKGLCLFYLCWLAWKIATAGAPDGVKAEGKPLTFLQAAAFQWVNPKAWAMAMTAISLYAPDRSLASVVLVGVIFGAVNLPSVSSWTLLGQQIRLVISAPGRLKAFNVTMAVLLILSVLPML